MECKSCYRSHYFEVTCIPLLSCHKQERGFCRFRYLRQAQNNKVLKFEHLDFGFVSDFDIWISDLFLVLLLVGGKGCFGVWPKHNP